MTNPYTDLQREMDKLLDGFWSPPQSSHRRDLEDEWTPVCDVSEDDGHYLLSLEMPGIPKDQIKLEVIDNQLKISGERRHEDPKKGGGAWYTERRFGKFQRTFALPTGTDAQKVEAGYQDGILRIHVPKAESAKPRQIKIMSESGPGLSGKFIGQSSTKDMKGKDERPSSRAEDVA